MILCDSALVCECKSYVSWHKLGAHESTWSNSVIQGGLAQA